MHSLLTPNVFRHILRNEPILHTDCLYRRVSTLRNPGGIDGARLICNHHYHRHHRHPRQQNHQQKRSLFGWISPVPREALTATGEVAALALLKDACARLDNYVRTPPVDDLAKAWSTFVKERSAQKSDGRFSDVEAVYVRRIFELLKKEAEGREQLQQWVSDISLKETIDCMPDSGEIKKEKTAQEAFLALSRMLYDEVESRTISDTELQSIWNNKGDKTRTTYESFWLKHIGILARCGYANEARDTIARSKLSLAVIETAWLVFIRRLSDGLVSLDNLNELPALIEQQLSPPSTQVKMRLAQLFSRQGSMSMARKYAVFKNDDGTLLTNKRYFTALIDACLQHNDLAWGQEIIKTIASDTPAMKKHQNLWNLMFKWALSTGKSVDEVNRMMDLMVTTNPDFTLRTKDINVLIKVANEKQDPYLAERLVALGTSRGCVPDQETYLLQMDYRLSVGDIEGARAAFDYVKSFDGHHPEAAIRGNNLIQAMCTRRATYSFDSIIEVVDFLASSNGRFSAETVAVLVKLHLDRDEYADVVDLLNICVKAFSLTERATVRTALLDVMLDADTPLPRLWDTYMIFQRIFEEAPRAERIPILSVFFTHRRADLALHVFNHMRNHQLPDMSPDVETYIVAMLGCAKLADFDSLSTVLNVLKLDVTLDETTRLHNARLLAFLYVGDVPKALAVWENDIVKSEEGPSRNSLVLIFRACEQAGAFHGEDRARDLWALVKKLDVKLDKDMVSAYVGALAGCGCEIEARELVERYKEEFGFDVDELILAKLFNGSSTSIKQQETQDWIQERYPDLWEKLEARGFISRIKNLRAVPLEVTLEP